MDDEALYLPDGDGFVGTHRTQGGWDPGSANGGTVLALLGHVLEDVPTLVPMTVARLTADLVRPVPLGRRLRVRPTVRREGKKLQVVDLLLVDQDDVELVRLTALRLRDADVPRGDLPPSTTEARPADELVPPDQVPAIHDGAPERPGFLEAVDLRRTPTRDGRAHGMWVRLVAPVVAGEPERATARLAFAVDYANLIGMSVHAEEVTLINPDVTGQVLRNPLPGWIGVTGDTRLAPERGRGLSVATLSDADGVFAVSTTSQLIQPR